MKHVAKKDKLGRQMLKKLKVYADADHKHQAQQPEQLGSNSGRRSRFHGNRTKFSYGTGRRKCSRRVRLYPGNGRIIVNNKRLGEYFGLDTLKIIVRQPLAVTGAEVALMSFAKFMVAV